METQSVNIRGHHFVIEVGTTPNDDIHWKWVNKGTWERDTFNAIDQHVDKDTFFVDIGAHIGMVSLYASALAHQVVAVEPDEAALSALKANIRLNNITNIEVIEKAIADGSKLTLYSGGLGNSMSNLMGKGAVQKVIDTVALKDILDNGSKLARTFIKVDIEGFEEKIADQIAEASKRDNVVMLISLHKNLSGSVSKDYISIVADSLKGFNHFENQGQAVDLDWIIQNGHHHEILCKKN
jgi:FkbM family methyltransferase